MLAYGRVGVRKKATDAELLEGAAEIEQQSNLRQLEGTPLIDRSLLSSIVHRERDIAHPPQQWPPAASQPGF